MEVAMTLCRFSCCCAIALTVIAVLPADTLGAQKSLRDQLVGVWVPTAHETTFHGGGKRQQFGANPTGMMILDATGNYTQILARPDLPKYRSNDRTQGTPEEHAATVRGSVANFGTWTVDEADKTLTYHILGSTFPNQASTDMKSTVSLVGDEWTSTIPRTTSGRRSVMVWKRAK
jgi:Lipocalin-like domain